MKEQGKAQDVLWIAECKLQDAIQGLASPPAAPRPHLEMDLARELSVRRIDP